jgi:hypothetical protein
MSVTWESHKPVANRRTRPDWVLDNKKLMEICVGPQGMRRFQIAQMYWRQNMTAKDIATVLEMTVTAVEKIIHRLTTVASDSILTKDRE